MDEVRKNLQEILSKIDGLYCILFTDRDGVPLLKISTDKTPENAIKPGFISTFCLAIDQGSKLGLGKTNTLICSYSQYQIIQMNKIPLIVTFIASQRCNTGRILALEDQLDPIISSLKLTVAEV
ncbi:ragulator complex protein LAMTOR3 homolog [Anthonomus grandis grandis]|uniref:ragulator complex protein LAMTOR3 homolog n=1 Tax=Anthonomus grandis grandis TaxID=2921223 RepID=UPI002166570E|nr:ragulator complex protein LAMTOR3 homolog [Anthonomus grandis grandis]